MRRGSVFFHPHFLGKLSFLFWPKNWDAFPYGKITGLGLVACLQGLWEGQTSQQQHIRPSLKQQHIHLSIKATPAFPSYLLSPTLFLNKLTLTPRGLNCRLPTMMSWSQQPLHTQRQTQILLLQRFFPTPLSQLSTLMQCEPANQ